MTTLLNVFRGNCYTSFFLSDIHGYGFHFLVLKV